MISNTVWIMIAIVVLLILGIVFYYKKKYGKVEKIGRLTSIGFVLIILGIVFGDTRLVGYSLMGAGVLLAIVDIILKMKENARK